MQKSIEIMADKIVSILSDNSASVYLYGSVALNDFKLGWSDIDILVLTDKPIDEQKANKLISLRQTLTGEYGNNPYFSLFEGGMLSNKAFFGNNTDTVVYWGTSGQRITDKYRIDSFATAELLDCGKLLRGKDVRNSLVYPTRAQFRADILHHYNVIRKYAQVTSAKITSCGWLLDIARGLYILRTNGIIAKTTAGEWAISEGILVNTEVLKRAVEIRKNPLKFLDNAETLEWCGKLGKDIQEFADVLEKELDEQ